MSAKETFRCGVLTLPALKDDRFSDMELDLPTLGISVRSVSRNDDGTNQVELGFTCKKCATGLPSFPSDADPAGTAYCRRCFTIHGKWGDIQKRYERVSLAFSDVTRD